MAAKYCPNPPQLKKDTNWLDYKFEVEAWQGITDLAKNKQGLALYLNLTDKAKTGILDKLGLDKIKEDEGVKHITD